MKTKASLTDIVKQLPVLVTPSDQYWGSFVKISGTDRFETEAVFRLLYCDWVISQDGRIIADSSASTEENECGLVTLIGCSINEVGIDLETHEIILFCSDGLKILLTENLAVYDDDDQMLVLALRGECISYCQETGLIIDPRNADRPRQND